jgi:hypothetical protein
MRYTPGQINQIRQIAHSFPPPRIDVSQFRQGIEKEQRNHENPARPVKFTIVTAKRISLG